MDPINQPDQQPSAVPPVQSSPQPPDLQSPQPSQPLPMPSYVPPQAVPTDAAAPIAQPMPQMAAMPTMLTPSSIPQAAPLAAMPSTAQQTSYVSRPTNFSASPEPKKKKIPTWLIIVAPVAALILIVVIITIIIALPKLQKNDWANTNDTKLNTIIASFNSDNTAADTAATGQNPAGLLAACNELSAEATKLQALPTYPVTATQTELSTAAKDIKQGSSECSEAINAGNASGLDQASKEIQTGMTSLNSAVSAIKAAKSSS